MGEQMKNPKSCSFVGAAITLPPTLFDYILIVIDTIGSQLQPATAYTTLIKKRARKKMNVILLFHKGGAMKQ
jgi:hypothetical protein